MVGAVRVRWCGFVALSPVIRFARRFHREQAMSNRPVIPPLQQVPLDLGPEPLRHFENFLPGGNEQWPHLHEVLSQPSPGLPIYLWGPPGSGKSHLLQAAVAQQQHAGQRVVTLDLHTDAPDDVEDGFGLLVLDDCDRFDAARQHAAFTLFVEATTFGASVLAAGRLPPVDLPVRDDLRTRLGWGLVYQLVPPAEDEMRALLRREADRRGIVLMDDVMDYLLKHSERDLGHLMSALDRLDHYALATKRSVSVALLRQMLATEEVR
jgi:DnaA family protein